MKLALVLVPSLLASLWTSSSIQKIGGFLNFSGILSQFRELGIDQKMNLVQAIGVGKNVNSHPGRVY